jgi:hypothetical protein
VVWLRKESAENGSFNLVYYEIPVFAKSYRGIEWSFATGEYHKGRTVKLLEGADQVRFRYYGYDVRDEKHRWRDVYEGSLTKRLPLLVQIAYARSSEEKMFMFGINVNSNLRMGYEHKYGR